jgi:putative copper resistance protein D
MPASQLVIARSVEFAPSLLVAGIFTFEILIAQAGRQSAAQTNPVKRRLLYLALWALVAAFLAALLWFAFEAANMSGRPLTRAFSGGSWKTVFSATRFGHVWALRLGLIGACLVLVTLRLRCNLEHAALRLLLWLFSFALLISLAWISHAAAEGSQPFGLLNDALHLCVAAAWLGGLPCLAIYLTTTPPATVTPILQRFSTLSLCCVSVLVVSGIANAWLLVGSLVALFATRYGALLLLKLALFAILLGFGARNRLLVKANSRSAVAPPALLARIRRNLRWEIGLGLGVVAVVGWLGATPPPRSSHLNGHDKLGDAATNWVDGAARFSLSDM